MSEDGENENPYDEIIELANAHLSPWLDFAAVLEARRSIKQRFSTGFPSLDAKLEGGLYAGTMTVVQGKPGIGKTMLATQIALSLGRFCAVAVLYADEGMAGASIRIGQQLGVPRADLMSGDGHELAVAALSKACPYWKFLDPSRAESTIDFMFEEFCKMAPKDMQKVFLLDSAQVIRSAAVNSRLDRRQAMSSLLVRIHDLALQYGAIVILVSQVARGSYRSKKEDEQSDPLAAGLETSMIEFMAEVILSLHGSPSKDDPSVELRCAKNRISADGTFRLPLAMDFPRARFLEPDMAQIEADAAIARDRTLRAIVAEILPVLRDEEDGMSARAIVSEIGKRTQEVLAALKFGVADGVLVRVKRSGRGGGTMFRVKS